MPVALRLRLVGIWLLLIGLVGFPGAGRAEPLLFPPDEALGPPVYSYAAIPVSGGEPFGAAPPIGEAVDERPGLRDEPEADWSRDPWGEAFADSPTGRVDFSGLPPYPVESNAAVDRFVELFRSPSRRAVVSRWLERSSRYLGMIREVFRRKGLPEDLAFTAMVESGFNPVAVSGAGAKGLWQLMERTGRRYGLRVDRWVDERLDPEKATEAAAEYLKDLFGQFGHWFLAQAAYNAGEVRVARAVERAGSSDFWTIARGRWLTEETRRFVPQILAAILIARDPGGHGFDLAPDAPMDYDRVAVPFSLSLKRLAALAGLPLDVLLELNAELRRGVTPPGETYTLKVPPGSGAAVGEALDRLEAGRSRVAARRGRRAGAETAAGVHIVRPGETLSHIALRYGLSLVDLVRLNGLDPGALIFPGDRIRLTASLHVAGHEATR